MNIFSNSNSALGGPKKVLQNLIKGLELSNINYTLNDENNISNKIYCQDNHKILYNEKYIESMVIGPNISVLPIENYIIMLQKYKKIITPSQWVYDLYKKWLPENKLEIFPIGIDYIKFNDFSKEEKTIDCLIYFKNRTLDELDYIVELLISLKQSYQIIKYGEYNEDYFINMLQKSRYYFLLNNTESQGIAVQEIMSTNTPLFVWDKDEWCYNNIIVKASSIPYWNNICGITTSDYNNISILLQRFLIELQFNNYNPRKYILDNLKIDEQSKKLYDLL